LTALAPPQYRPRAARPTVQLMTLPAIPIEVFAKRVKGK